MVCTGLLGMEDLERSAEQVGGEERQTERYEPEFINDSGMSPEPCVNTR